MLFKILTERKIEPCKPKLASIRLQSCISDHFIKASKLSVSVIVHFRDRSSHSAFVLGREREGERN